MSYHVVFDLASHYAQLWPFWLVCLLIFAVGCIVFVVLRKRNFFIASAVFGFSFIWIAIIYASLYRPYITLLKSMTAGEAKVIEGPVTDFHPMPVSGHDDERFCVKATCFSYSDYNYSFGFDNTSSHGGPIRQGLHVRVTYIGNTIVKLEVAQ